MSQDDPTVTSEMIGLVLKMSKLNPSREELTWPEDMTHVGIVGCPGMRQCEIKTTFRTLMFRERGMASSHFVTISMEQIMRRIWVSIMKANDGMAPEEALRSGLRTLPGFDYLTLSDELIVTDEQMAAIEANSKS